ncbi:S8 family serine peptidase [Paractinoplanes maris]|uniref:S8 family serine peptidase n=1 Tax=Paractinoplanes maris TaxID=1734446 RepID=UPI00201FCCAB|nr:S8 family serine peptidase [Actinoplanes maris]
MDQERSRRLDLQVGNEIVVELEYVPLVSEELIHFGVTVDGEPDRNQRLGLGRLRLKGLAVEDTAATTDPGAGVGDDARGHWKKALGAILAGDGPEPTNLDVCLAAMRSWFAGKYGGFVPAFGKNRGLQDVEGLPYISGGGVSKVPTLPRTPPPAIGRVGSPDGAGVRVGLADTPIFANAQLEGRYDKDVATFVPEGVVKPASGHATFIAGLVLQRAPGAFLVVRPALGTDAHGTSWDVATSLMAFLDEKNRVDVLPLALGTYTMDGRPPLVLTRAMERLTSRTVVVAAAGNHGKEPFSGPPGQLTSRTVTHPASEPRVCAVAAADADGKLAEFSPPDLPWFQLKARGVDVSSLYLDARVQIDADQEPERFEGFASWSGSSFAVATVAGEIARRTVPGRVTAREALDQILAHGADGIWRARD